MIKTPSLTIFFSVRASGLIMSLLLTYTEMADHTFLSRGDLTYPDFFKIKSQCEITSVITAKLYLIELILMRNSNLTAIREFYTFPTS